MKLSIFALIVGLQINSAVYADELPQWRRVVVNDYVIGADLKLNDVTLSYRNNEGRTVLAVNNEEVYSVDRTYYFDWSTITVSWNQRYIAFPLFEVKYGEDARDYNCLQVGEKTSSGWKFRTAISKSKLPANYIGVKDSIYISNDGSKAILNIGRKSSDVEDFGWIYYLWQEWDLVSEQVVNTGIKVEEPGQSAKN